MYPPPLNDIIDLYKEEGINVLGWDGNQSLGKHVLEGGDTLYTPDKVSASYLRLYCQPHEIYYPKSPRVRDLAEKLKTASKQPPGT